MRDDVRKLIDRSVYYQGSLREIAALLPASDAELDEWLTHTVQESDGLHFFYLVSAALLAERKVDAKHLAGGAMMLPSENYLAGIALHMQGAVAEHLLAAVERGGLLRGLEATALFLAAAWWRKHGEESPPRLIGAARHLARQKNLSAETDAGLFALAALTGDESLKAILGPERVTRLAKEAQGYGDAVMAIGEKPFEEMIVKTPHRERPSHRPMRRSVARIGRNAPCPCGSGKKYKHCCARKDEERLHLSTEIAGKTYAELQADLDSHLTPAMLDRTQPYELARLDPRKIAPDLLLTYLLRLAAFSLFDQLAAAFEQLGVPADLEDEWQMLFIFVIKKQRRGVAERMVKAHPRGEAILPELSPGVRLLLASNDPANFVRAVEEEALAALQTEDSNELEQFAFGVLHSPCPALGIFVARSLLLTVKKRDALFLFEHILEARDKLNLSPDDLFSDLLDERFAEETPHDSDALRAARGQLTEKASEVRRLKDSLDALHKEIDRREKRSAPHATAVTSKAAPDEDALRDLRSKVGELKSLLKERGEERVTLRRNLEKLQHDVDALKLAGAVNGAKSPATRPDEEAGEALEITGHQPVRLIEFPRKFGETLARFPQHVGSGAMARLGRIAAGEPSAFSGVIRLQECHEVLRLRLAGDYRLLFRLLPDRVQVVDLINRKELLRKIKLLRANGLPLRG